MKFLKFIVVFVLLFFLTSNQLIAQKWVPYAGYVKGKSSTVLKFEGSGAMLGIAIEKPIKKNRLFFEVGLELTYLQHSEELEGGAICENCDPATPFPSYRQRYLELAMPILVKIKLLKKQRSTLMVKSGYAPTLSLPITSYYYTYTDLSANIVERFFYKNSVEYIHTFYSGLDYRFNVKENFAIELSPICKYQMQNFSDSNLRQKRLQFGFVTRLVFNF